MNMNRPAKSPLQAESYPMGRVSIRAHVRRRVIIKVKTKLLSDAPTMGASLSLLSARKAEKSIIVAGTEYSLR